MTTSNDSNQKTLGLAAGSTLKLSVNNKMKADITAMKSTQQHSSNVIVVTKGRHIGVESPKNNNKELKKTQDVNLSKFNELRESDIFNIKDKQPIPVISIKKQEEVVANHDQNNQIVDEEPSEPVLENKSDDTAQDLQKRSHYLRDLTISKGKVRNLDQLYTSKASHEEGRVKDSIDDISSVIPIVAAESKKTPIVDKKKSEKNFIEEKDNQVVVKKTALASETKRLNRQSSNKGSLSHFVMMNNDDEENPYIRKSMTSIRQNKHKKNKKVLPSQEKVFREVLIPDLISIQELSNRMTEKASDLIKALMKMGMMVTVNQSIDADTAELVVLEFGHKPKRVTDAEFEKGFIKEQIDNPDDLVTKAPVVTIMGHVDHGKTSLLDALRLTDVVAKEAGGITQHIGAYNVTLSNGKSITFLDTPGHEAFTAMRMRGAKVTDIVVLVVAADDGIKEQTVEAINHAKAAGVPIIVAINKIDKPDSNPERVKNELLSHNLVPEDMGGEVIVINVSAKTKQGLDQLEESILSQAEVLDLKANPNIKASGAVIEASMDKARGPVATVLVQRGTLKIGDILVAGLSYGKVKNLLDDKGGQVKNSGPAVAVEMLGLNQAPVAGDTFSVVESESVAKELVDFRIHKEKERKLFSARKDSLEKLFTKARDSSAHKELSIIVKGDVNGSVEAICSSLLKIVHDEITIKILHSGVGGITESDITLAAASNALIVAFNVRANNQARDMAKQLDVDIKYYSIIYNLIDDIKAAASGMLNPTIKEKISGYAEIRQVFDLTKFGKVAGCNVTEGNIQRHCHARLIRDNIVIHEGKLKALKRFKEDVKEVKTGFECGISFERYEDMKVGDKIESFLLIEEARQL